MKKTIVVLGIIIASLTIYSCDFSKKNSDSENNVESPNQVEKEAKTMLGQPKTLETKTIENYFIKNNVTLSEASNYFVFLNSEAFESKFGVAKTMTNTVEAIDFKTNSIAAIVLKPTNQQTEIIIESVKQIGTGIRISYSITSGEETTHTTTPVKLVKLPNNAAVQSVSFETNNEVVNTTTLK